MGERSLTGANDTKTAVSPSSPQHEPHLTKARHLELTSQPGSSFSVDQSVLLNGSECPSQWIRVSFSMDQSVLPNWPVGLSLLQVAESESLLSTQTETLPMPYCSYVLEKGGVSESARFQGLPEAVLSSLPGLMTSL